MSAPGELRAVLITGATGLLGTHFIRHLNDAGCVPRVLLRNEYPGEAWGDLRVEPARGDLTAGPAGRDAALGVALNGIDTVYHLAAYVHVGAKGRRRHEELNLAGTAVLYNAAARAGVKRFIHVSTVGAVGGSADGTVLDETAEWNLGQFRNPYFDTKRSAEKFLLSPHGEEIVPGLPPRAPGPDVVVVNPSIILGAKRSVRSRAAAIREQRPWCDRAVPAIPEWTGCLRFFLLRPPISINLVDADDVCRGLILAAERGRAGERYLLTGHNLDWPALVRELKRWIPLGNPLIPLPGIALRASAEVTQTLSRCFGFKTKWTPDRARLATLTWFYSPAKAERELGWSRTPIRESLEKILPPLR